MSEPTLSSTARELAEQVGSNYAESLFSSQTFEQPMIPGSRTELWHRFLGDTHPVEQREALLDVAWHAAHTRWRYLNKRALAEGFDVVANEERINCAPNPDDRVYPKPLLQG